MKAGTILVTGLLGFAVIGVYLMTHGYPRGGGWLVALSFFFFIAVEWENT